MKLAALAAALVLAAGTALAGTLTLMGAGAGTSGPGCLDASWASVVLLAGNNNATNGTTTFADQSSKAHSITIGAGSPAYTTTSPPPGMTSSISIPGSGAFLQSANSADWQLGTGDWTFEAYVSVVNNAAANTFITTMINSGVADEILMTMNISGTTTFAFGSPGAWALISGGGGGGPIANNTWTHVSWTRNGNNFYAGVGGTTTLIGTVSGTGSTLGPLAIGATSGDNTSWPLNGTIAAIRVTKGVARYGASNFTPPTLPLPTC